MFTIKIYNKKSKNEEEIKNENNIYSIIIFALKACKYRNRRYVSQTRKITLFNKILINR
jgi:hypothetical protein